MLLNDILARVFRVQSKPVSAVVILRIQFHLQSVITAKVGSFTSANLALGRVGCLLSIGLEGSGSIGLAGEGGLENLAATLGPKA